MRCKRPPAATAQPLPQFHEQLPIGEIGGVRNLHRPAPSLLRGHDAHPHQDLQRGHPEKGSDSPRGRHTRRPTVAPGSQTTARHTSATNEISSGQATPAEFTIDVDPLRRGRPVVDAHAAHVSRASKTSGARPAHRVCQVVLSRSLVLDGAARLDQSVTRRTRRGRAQAPDSHHTGFLDIDASRTRSASASRTTSRTNGKEGAIFTEVGAVLNFPVERTEFAAMTQAAYH